MFYVLADVLPFYISWTASSLLMINRQMGRTGVIFLCMGMGYLEYKARIMYGDQSMQPLYDQMQSFFPRQWTLGESLAQCRASISIILMLVIFVFDATLDRVDSKLDPCKNLNRTVDRQVAISQRLLKLRARVNKMKDLEERDQLIKTEILDVQKEIRTLAQSDLLECIGECMDESELKVKSESVFARIFKIMMSVMIFIQVINYMQTGSKKSKKKRK